MSSSIEYYLTFTRNCINEYDVCESHSCPDKDNWTSDQFINTCLPEKVEEFVKEFQKGLTDGKVVGFEVDGYVGDGSL